MRKESRAMSSEWALESCARLPTSPSALPVPTAAPTGFPCRSPLRTTTPGISIVHSKATNLMPSRPIRSVSFGRHQCRPTVGPKDGTFTLQYKSAIAFGHAELVETDAEKIEGLRLISERFLPQHMDAFDQSIEQSLSRTAVVRITLTASPTGKRKQYDKNGDEMKYGA